LPEDGFMSDGNFVICGQSQVNIKEVAHSLKFLKAGPKMDLHFNHSEVRAAIVTCGGLCPGLNVVIRELVMSLHFNYAVKKVYGIKWGYKGFYSDPETHWFELKPKNISDIHKHGGTILGSSRGGFDSDENGMKILKALQKK
jgi:6-phosphofructokinase 1